LPTLGASTVVRPPSTCQSIRTARQLRVRGMVTAPAHSVRSRAWRAARNATTHGHPSSHRRPGLSRVTVGPYPSASSRLTCGLRRSRYERQVSSRRPIALQVSVEWKRRRPQVHAEHVRATPVGTRRELVEVSGSGRYHHSHSRRLIPWMNMLDSIAGSPQERMSGTCSCSSRNAIMISRRARLAPRQKCGPPAP
jgi:hypothetical protein